MTWTAHKYSINIPFSDKHIAKVSWVANTAGGLGCMAALLNGVYMYQENDLNKVLRDYLISLGGDKNPPPKDAQTWSLAYINWQKELWNKNKGLVEIVRDTVYQDMYSKLEGLVTNFWLAGDRISKELEVQPCITTCNFLMWLSEKKGWPIMGSPVGQNLAHPGRGQYVQVFVAINPRSFPYMAGGTEFFSNYSKIPTKEVFEKKFAEPVASAAWGNNAVDKEAAAKGKEAFWKGALSLFDNTETPDFSTKTELPDWLGGSTGPIAPKEKKVDKVEAKAKVAEFIPVVPQPDVQPPPLPPAHFDPNALLIQPLFVANVVPEPVAVPAKPKRLRRVAVKKAKPKDGLE